MSYQTIQVRFQEPICFLRFNRPEARNTINLRLIEECHQVMTLCEDSIVVIVLEGLPEFFCFGADFHELHQKALSGKLEAKKPGDPLYDLWLKLATGPYITISHVRGKANAGGVGFVAASDLVLADQTAQFSLSELLFGLLPACVLPFLVRRIGFQKANYLTLMTHPISVEQAHAWGLVDAYEDRSVSLLRRHLLRLKRLSKEAVLRYKRYINGLYGSLLQSKSSAVAANREAFSDPHNLRGIFQYLETGRFPWED
jgi:polyketide biosynthesis enoyl-CoA hydratase PksH